MLPVTLQIPAAIILVLGGAVACFAGYRFFRIVLGLYGFVLGALLATTVAGAGSTSSLLLWAVVGALAAMWLQRYVVVTGTAFGGAWTLLVGVLALMGDATAQAAAVANDVWVVYPLDPAPGRRWLPMIWLALGVAGMFIQLRKSGPRVKKLKRNPR